MEGDGWTFVSEDTSGHNPITVYKKTVPPGTHVQSASGEADEAAAEKHACIKVTALLNAAPHDLYQLFLDNSRVSEYNEHCALLEDVEVCSRDTKVSWSVTGAFGPFKVRVSGGWGGPPLPPVPSTLIPPPTTISANALPAASLPLSRVGSSRWCTTPRRPRPSWLSTDRRPTLPSPSKVNTNEARSCW